ncbi:Alpha-tectorin, partial [Oryzias melastigma]
ATCEHVCSEGCFCDEGFVRSGTTCVPVESCGCQYEGFYYSVGESFWKDGCSERCECFPSDVMRCAAATCTAAQECTIKNGHLGCYDDGLTTTLAPPVTNNLPIPSSTQPPVTTTLAPPVTSTLPPPVIITDNVPLPSCLYPISGTASSRSDDGSSPLIQLHGPFAYFGKLYNSIYVNHNGHLTFDQSYYSYSPQRFPLYGSMDIIAPFWTDLDNRQNGFVLYNQYTNGSVLQQATQDINSYFPNLNFSAEWVFVATWYEVAYYPTTGTKTTFQAVLISGGQKSFLLMNYGSIASTSRSVQAGYDTINSFHHFTLPGSFSSSATGVNSTFTLGSNVNVTGRWAFQVDSGVRGCQFNGEPVQLGDSFWSDSTCAQKCTCTRAGLQCSNQPCSFSQVCMPDSFQFSCQTVQRRTCTVSGDPHYYTFDDTVFHFQGTCTYVLSEQCQNELPYFRVEGKNEHLGSTRVSWTGLVKVFVYNETIELVKRTTGKAKVNGNFVATPFSLNQDRVQVYQSGMSMIVSTDFGLMVAYDRTYYLRISLPYTYQNATCGLCGNFNNQPGDDLRTREGEIVSSDVVFANSWRASGDDDPGCEAQCEGLECAGCNAAQTALYSNDEHCGILQNSSGPFAACHQTLSPQNFVDSCVYDQCVGGGYQPFLCQAIGVYAGYDTINSFHHFTLPGSFSSSATGVNSTFTLGSNVNVTGRWAFQKCTCTRAGLQCSNQPCSFSQVCMPDSFQFSCQTVQRRTCTVSGDPHYYTFDDTVFHFQGTCTYVLSEQCQNELPYFRVEGKNEHLGSTRVSWTGLVKVFVYNETIELVKRTTGKAKVNGNFVATPFSLNQDRVQVYQSGMSMIVSTDFGLMVAYDRTYYLRISLPYTYQNATCGLCGNFNNQPGDDLRTREGEVVSSDVVFANSWRASGDDDPGCEAQCEGLECAGCNAAQTALYSNDEHCGILQNSSGPFAACHQTLPPQNFVDSCVYDQCVGGGYQPFLCQAIGVYGTCSYIITETGRHGNNDTRFEVVATNNHRGNNRVSFVSSVDINFSKDSESVRVRIGPNRRVKMRLKIYSIIRLFFSAESDPCEQLDCTENEWCGEKHGVYGCFCDEHHHRPNNGTYDSSITCQNSSGTMSVSRCQLFEAGFPSSALHLRDSSCKGTVEDGKLVFHFDNNDHLCGTVLRSNGTHFIYENTIQSETAPSETLISRQKKIKLCFSCAYPLSQAQSMDVGINPVESIMKKKLPAGSGSYHIRMTSYTDPDFRFPFTNETDIEVDEMLYVKVKTEGVDQHQLATILDSCWATPINTEDYPIRWDLIINECPNPEDGTVELIQSGVSTVAQFSFRMFTFKNFSSIFVHCNVHLCLLNSSDCTPQCDSDHRRFKRDLSHYDHQPLSLGPVDMKKYGVVTPQVEKPLYPKAGTESTAIDDGSSPPITLQRSFVYFGRAYDKIYVNHNGHLTFNSPYSSYSPERFPLNGPIDIIAPFWTDLDNREMGKILYNQYTSGRVLQKATQDINTYFPNLNFKAEWVFVATWNEVAYYPNSRTKTTAQAVLISGGQNSFVLMNYGIIASTSRKVQAGYDTINSEHHYTLPGSFSSAATGSNSNFRLSSNVNVPGRWAFRTDNGTTGCTFNVCMPDSFQFSCQSVQRRTCTVSGDPHYYTFDNKVFHFQGTCTYVLSEQCQNELPYFRVEAKNEHLGSTRVSWTGLVKVFVYNETIELVKRTTGKAKVNGSFVATPFSLNQDRVQVYQSGMSMIVSTDFGLMVAYDRTYYLRISLPYTYQNATCGLCGNFNDNPGDDLRTREGEIVSSDVVFANSWQVPGEDEPGCEAQCEGLECAGCNANQTALYSNNEHCGILQNSSGPFAPCHQTLPPPNFVDSCVYDLCVGEGYQPFLCQALGVYASQCQQNGIQPESWRRPGFCDESDPCEQLDCTENEWCGEKDGVYGCFCDEHHQRPNSESFDSSITCASSSGTLSLSRCQLFEAGFPFSALHLRNDSCKGTLQDGRLVFHFNNDDHPCGTVFRSNGTHFIYENSVQGDVDPHNSIITHEKSFHLLFSCAYPVAQALSMDVAINSLESIVNKRLPSGEGHYSLRMIPYEDPNFQSPLNRNRNLEMEINQRLYIEVLTEGVDERQISTILDSCWATPFNDANYPVRWNLINHECPNPADGTVELVQNGISTAARFSFKMFTFTNYSSIYLHCQVHLCLLGHSNCTAHCISGYHRRVARDVSHHDTAAISIGPLHTAPGVVTPQVVEPLYPISGTESSRTDDGSSPPITLRRTFVYFGQTYNTIYVNHNGHLTFDSSYSAHTPVRFPIHGPRDMIAPFWTDLDNREMGKILYNQYTSGSVLQKATQDINTYFPSLNFTAEWVFVATWYEVAYYSNSGTAGYDTINSEHHYTIPGSFSSAATGSNSNFRLNSNVDVPGRWAFRTDHGSRGCTFNGEPVQLGDSFWSDSNCAQKCTCTTTGLQCSNQPCSFSQVCMPDSFQFSCQSVQRQTCTVSGDPHYYTFDNKVFSFQGTCTYVLSEQCQNELPYFRVEAKNEHLGSTRVSWTGLVKVFVYNETIELVKRTTGKAKVNGNFVATPFSLNQDRVQVYQSGMSMIVSTDFGLMVAYDRTYYLRISLPYTYQNATCGLCGNFNDNPGDDLRTREGEIVSSEVVFANSWQVPGDDEPGCEPQCEGLECAGCNAAQTALYSNDEHCGILQNSSGPFAACHQTLPPQNFVDSCVYDLCVGEGYQPFLCQALGVYASQCQQNGIQPESWRRPGFCVQLKSHPWNRVVDKSSLELGHRQVIP